MYFNVAFLVLYSNHICTGEWVSTRPKIRSPHDGQTHDMVGYLEETTGKMRLPTRIIDPRNGGLLSQGRRRGGGGHGHSKGDTLPK